MGTRSSLVERVPLTAMPSNARAVVGGFKFTLPMSFSGNKTYAERGASLADCFVESAWMDDSLVERMEMGSLGDPLCGAPRASMSSDFRTDGAGGRGGDGGSGGVGGNGGP